MFVVVKHVKSSKKMEIVGPFASMAEASAYVHEHKLYLDSMPESAIKKLSAPAAS